MFLKRRKKKDEEKREEKTSKDDEILFRLEREGFAFPLFFSLFFLFD